MDDCDSLRLALEGEKHCHRLDNAYLLERAERAEAAARDFVTALRTIREYGGVGTGQCAADALAAYPDYDHEA